MLSPNQLPTSAADAITDPGNEVHVSVASAWEIAIKLGIKKLNAPLNVAAWLPQRLAYHRLKTLPVELRHATAVERLPHHHRDPFDRLLVAQALVERLTLATGDPALEPCGAPLLRCW